jgi:mRNA-degrading endonuclease toxin of MazEF toxin-antitoxin module
METLFTIPKRAVLKRLGALPKQAMREADQALAFSLDLSL